MEVSILQPIGRRKRLESSETVSFIELVRSSHEELSDLPVIDRSGEKWQGKAIILPPQIGSGVVFGLDIEEVGDEIMISFDHSHIHLAWPPRPCNDTGRIWHDGLALVDAILNEKVLASSGWIDGALRVGALHEADVPPDLLVPALHHIRVRSWRGTLNRDEAREPNGS